MWKKQPSGRDSGGSTEAMLISVFSGSSSSLFMGDKQSGKPVFWATSSGGDGLLLAFWIFLCVLSHVKKVARLSVRCGASRRLYLPLEFNWGIYGEAATSWGKLHVHAALWFTHERFLAAHGHKSYYTLSFSALPTEEIHLFIYFF